MTILEVYQPRAFPAGGGAGATMWVALSGVAVAAVQLAEPVLLAAWSTPCRVDRRPSRPSACGPRSACSASCERGGCRRGRSTGASPAADGAWPAFERAIILPISYHAEKGSGTVVRTILAGTDALFWNWLSFLREQLTALVGIAVLVPTAITMNKSMALILIVLAVLYLIFNLLVVRRTSDGQATVEQYHNNVYGRVGDVLGNVTVVQSYTRLAAEMQAMRSVMSELLAAQYPVLTWWGLLTVLTRAAATVTMVAIFAVGALLVQRGEITVGEIVAFVAFANLLITKLDLLSGFAVRIFQYAPTLRSFFDLIDATDGAVEHPHAKTLQIGAGNIAYEHVTFRFRNSDQGVFDVSFLAPAGKTIALVGPTGAGKTTTLALLQRLRSPEEGRILIDGQDITDVTLASLRGSIAVVFQDAGLFNRSIGDNIRIGRPEATDAEVEQAARLAEAHDFIVKKPAGYGFVIGERGASLSGGERQRLAIARAILKNAPILILDEATSALDVETESSNQARHGSRPPGPHHLHHCPPPIHGCRCRPDPGA